MQRVKLDPKTKQEVAELALANRKPEAMKIIIDKTGCGLRLAKDYVDEISQKSSVQPNNEQTIALRNARNASGLSDLYVRAIPEPLRRTSPKLGRNDLCSCGSGQKYKKCCLAKNL